MAVSPGIPPSVQFGQPISTARQEADDAAAKAAEKLQKDQERESERARAELQRFRESLASVVASAFAASSSVKELGENMKLASAQLANMIVQRSVGGIGGIIGGGIAEFLINQLIGNKDEALPITDNALDSRIINWSEGAQEMAAVRDRSELSFSSQRSRRWRDAAAAAG